MNIRYVNYLFAALLLCFLSTSCSNDDSTTIYNQQSSDAQIYSFSITGVPRKISDSTENVREKERFDIINKTKFAIDQVAGVIYNPDSMPYGTVLHHKVKVNATFNPSYGAGNVFINIPDSVDGFNWNKSDSVNFSKLPITFRVTPFDGTSTNKAYNIDIRIHKIDPDTLTWQSIPSFPASTANFKSILVKENELEAEKFYLYSVENNQINLFVTDKNNISWNPRNITGLPGTLIAKSICVMNSVFYAIDSAGNSYKSSNGMDWAKADNGKNVVSILGVIPAENRSDDVLLLAVNDNSKYYFAKTKDMSSVEMVDNIEGYTDNEIPANFPIREGGDLTHFSTDRNTRILIISGGLDKNNTEISSTWIIRNTTEGVAISPFVRNTFFKGAGISTFLYDNSLYVLAKDQFYISRTWGDIWLKAPNKQMLDPGIVKRSGQSLIVDSENNIWIFGGVSEDGKNLNDVWKGRLNRLIP